MRVFLIEDSASDLRLAKKALTETKVPHELQAVRDGEEALRYFDQRPVLEPAEYPDLILLDLNLPRVNGKEILGFIKNCDRLLHIPVIVFSTSNAERDILEAYRLGANSYLRKPKDFSEWVDIFSALTRFWLVLAELPGRKRNE